jgi:hypothetical protein
MVKVKETVTLPRKLTAENGAKSLLIGEFSECFDPDNSGNPYIVPVSWDNIKRIYDKIVGHYERNPIKENMNKPKPIFTIGIPIRIPIDDVAPLMESITDKFSDYHVLFYTSEEREFEFKCFYEKDFNEVKFEELKKMVLEGWYLRQKIKDEYECKVCGMPFDNKDTLFEHYNENHNQDPHGED